jgi:hypothetical protein
MDQKKGSNVGKFTPQLIISIFVIYVLLVMMHFAHAEESDIHVTGPIDGQYVITLTYRGFTYETIVKGMPDSDKNITYLIRWEAQKMEERDAALQYHHSAPQVP